MSTTYVPAPMRRQVIQRSGGRCEYCRFPESANLFTFEVEHIISEKHGGKTTLENLALACPYCNRAKGSDLGSLDPETQQLTPFFNPRTQNWEDHFTLTGAEIVPLTAEARVTVFIFQFNEPRRLQERQQLLAIGRYPWKSEKGE